jgi:hypothetical protein
VLELNKPEAGPGNFELWVKESESNTSTGTPPPAHRNQSPASSEFVRDFVIPGRYANYIYL